MEITWEGPLPGVFEGYSSGKMYELSDGTRWRQESPTREHCHREGPRAKLLRERSTGLTFLDVEGTSAVVAVRPARGIGCGAGAF